MHRLLTIFGHLFSLIEKIADVIINLAFTYFVDAPNPPAGYTASFGKPKKYLSRFNKGFCLTGSKSISLHHSCRNVMIVGGTGVGKSSVVLLPTLLQMKGSFIIHDPSGELYKKSAGYLKSQGYKVLTLNFADPVYSSGFNPLARISDASSIHKVSSLIIRTILGTPQGDPFWNLQATGLLSFLIKLVMTDPKETRTLHQVRHYLMQLTANPHLIEELAQKRDTSTLVAEITSFLSYDEKVKAGILATVSAALQIFADDTVAKVTSHDTIDLADFRARPTALYIQNPVTDQSYYAVLSSLFFEQLFGTLLKVLPKSDEQNVFCLIDEAGVLTLPSLANTIANIRKYRAGLLLALQDKSQLVDQYGQHQARTIESNCYTKLFFTGQSGSAAIELEQILGRFQYQDPTGKIQTRPLMTRDEVRTMPTTQGLIIAGHLKPLLVKLSPYYSNLRLARRARLPVPPPSYD